MHVTALAIMTLTVAASISALAGDASAPLRAVPAQDAARASGLVALNLIGRDTDEHRLFRVTFPAEMRVKDGTWLIVEGAAALRRPFSACTDVACVAEYEATTELIATMKAHRNLILQAVNASGRTLSASLRLDDDFWATHHVVQAAMEERLTPWQDDRVMRR
jgi:hypothetical protein